MSTSNGVALPFIVLLLSTSVFSQNLVFGSPDPKQRFDRPDPLHHFKLYKGGYDIDNRHYWASAAFTGVHGYVISSVWMLCGLVFGGYLILKHFKGGPSAITNRSDHSYFIIFTLIVIFSILAIVATSLVMVANKRTLQRTQKLKATIIEVGVDATRTIEKVTKAMKEMQFLLQPYDPTTYHLLNTTSNALGSNSEMIQRFVHKKTRSINTAIQTLYITNLVAVTVNLVLLIAALVLLLLHWHPGLIIVIIFFCWILTTLCWALTGLDFFIHTFAEDTCSALGDFEQNPQNNSLSSMLPCGKPSDSDKTLVKIGFTVHTFIAKLNSKMRQIIHESLGLNEQSDESLGFRMICDPFSGPPNYSYTPEKCSKDAIPIGDLPNVLQRFTCYKETPTGKCEGDGRFLPETSYIMAWAYSRSIQDLIDIFPDLQRLSRCSFVKHTFADIVLHQCKPLRVSSRMLWSSMLALSITMVVLVLLWVAKAHQDMGRCFSVCSVIPRPT